MEKLTIKYLTYCELQKGLNPTTIKAYKINLKQYINFCHHSFAFSKTTNFKSFIKLLPTSLNLSSR